VIKTEIFRSSLVCLSLEKFSPLSSEKPLTFATVWRHRNAYFSRCHCISVTR